MIWRASLKDIERVNAWVSRDSGHQVDFTEILSNSMNVCLCQGEGGAIFVWRGPGVFEVHLFLEQRGREALSLVRQMLGEMKSYGAEWFWAAIPEGSRHVIMFARLIGWKSQGIGDFPHGRCEIFRGEK